MLNKDDLFDLLENHLKINLQLSRVYDPSESGYGIKVTVSLVWSDEKTYDCAITTATSVVWD